MKTKREGVSDSPSKNLKKSVIRLTEILLDPCEAELAPHSGLTHPAERDRVREEVVRVDLL